MGDMQKTTRSISLPSRLHPNSHKIGAELNKLKTWELSSLSSTTPLGAETIQMGLVRLAELYICVEELIHSPLTQQALHNHHGKLAEEALDLSVELLDACGTARDLFLIMKEHVQELQSALRRRGGDSSIENNINAFICFRKRVKKDVVKSLGALKRLESHIGSFIQLDGDSYLFVVIKVLRELSTITISVFRSLMLFLSRPAMKTSSGWSMMKKLMFLGSIKSETSHNIFNEVGSVDHALYYLHGQIQKNDIKVHVQLARERLETLDDGIKSLEAGLDGLFRCLIQHRVTLLNILTS
ncbi:Selection and upkeep of intraepithelial T-cells protein 6, putative [Fagus crenata]